MAGRRQHGEGSVFRRSRDGRWVARADLGWRDGKRDQRLFTAASPEEAIRKRTEFLDRRRGGFTVPKGRPLYVSEWMVQWLNLTAKRKVKASTWERSYRQKVTELIAPYFERVALAELEESHIECWHAELEERVSERTGKPLSASTIGQAHRIMSAAIKVAVARRLIARNPCSNVTPPAAAAAEAEPPTLEEMGAILAACRQWPNGARWILAATTGLRQGEALALEWRDVDLKGEVPSVTVREGKTRNARRTVELLPEAVEALRRHRQAQGGIAAGLVFRRADGRAVHPRADWQDWQDLLASLGLPRYRVHDLRHATATFLLEAGADIRVVQAIMGHATPDFTRRAYQHVRPALRRRAVADLGAYLRGE